MAIWAAKVLEVPSRITVVLSGLTAGSFYAVYVFDNAGTTAVEVSLTGPAAPYRGTARSKTSDPTRRFLGWILAASATTMRKFSWGPRGVVLWLESIDATPFRVLTDGRATVKTTVPCAAVVPPTSCRALVYHQNFHTSSAFFGSSDDAFVLSSTSWLDKILGNDSSSSETHLDSSQAFTYRFLSGPTTTDSLYSHVRGYVEAR